MKAMTKHQYRTLLNLQWDMSRVGWHPAIAGKLLRRALDRVNGRAAGMGKIHQTRRLTRELDPTIPPRLQVAGEQCRRIQEVPGQETALYSPLNQLRNQGWNVMQIESSQGWPALKTYWACPPGTMPRQSQRAMMHATPWGSPLYMKTEF